MVTKPLPQVTRITKQAPLTSYHGNQAGLQVIRATKQAPPTSYHGNQAGLSHKVHW